MTIYRRLLGWVISVVAVDLVEGLQGLQKISLVNEEKISSSTRTSGACVHPEGAHKPEFGASERLEHPQHGISIDRGCHTYWGDLS